MEIKVYKPYKGFIHFYELNLIYKDYFNNNVCIALSKNERTICVFTSKEKHMLDLILSEPSVKFIDVSLYEIHDLGDGKIAVLLDGIDLTI